MPLEVAAYGRGIHVKGHLWLTASGIWVCGCGEGGLFLSLFLPVFVSFPFAALKHIALWTEGVNDSLLKTILKKAEIGLLPHEPTAEWIGCRKLERCGGFPPCFLVFSEPLSPILSFLIIDQVAPYSQLKNRGVAGCYRFSATESDDTLSTHEVF